MLKKIVPFILLIILVFFKLQLHSQSGNVPSKNTLTLIPDIVDKPCLLDVFIDPVSYCSGSSAVLNATFDGGGDPIARPNYKWIPTTGLSSSSVLNPTVSVATTTAYTLTVRWGGCVGTSTVNVQVTPIPTITGVGNGQRCDPGTVQLQANASAGTVNWYSGSSSTSSLFTGNNFTSPTLSNTTIYYVEAVDNGCSSSPRNSVTAAIGGAPQFQYTNAGAICGESGQALLTANTSSGTVNWFTSPTGGTSLFTGNNFQTPVITTATTYYAEASDNGCVTSPRLALTADVYKLTLNPFPSATITPGGSVQLNASFIGGLYNWNPNTGLNNPGIANPLASPLSTTTYTVVGSGGPRGCSLNKTVTVNVGGGAAPTLAPSYATVVKQLDDTYCQLGADKKLRFKYINEYSNTSTPLNYKIYNYNRIPVASLPSLNKVFGENMYTVDLNAFSLAASTIYYLEVTSDKNEKYFLKFKTP